MIRNWFFPGLLDTGPVCDRLVAVRDGFVNLYVFRAPAGLVCIDAGWRPTRVRHGFALLGLDVRNVAAVFLTHLHWDHARGRDLFTNAQVFVSEHESPSFLGGRRKPAQPLTPVRDGQTLTAAGVDVHAIAAPGHTPGSVAYLVDRRFLFTSDTLGLRHGDAVPFGACFNRDGTALRRSIRKLAALSGIERLLTAHTGSTVDVGTAFRRWRGAGADVPPQERARP